MRRTCPFGPISKRSRQKTATGRRDAARIDDSGDGNESAIVERRDRLRPVPLHIRERSRGRSPRKIKC